MDDLDAVGYKVTTLGKRELVSVPWRTYYHRDGKPTRLPGDPDSVRSYLARGFSLEPPARPSGGDIGVKCSKCGFVAKSAFGLQAHMRKHERESKKEER